MHEPVDARRERSWRWWLWPALAISFLLFALPQVFFIAMGLHRNLGFGRLSPAFTAANYVRILTEPLYLSSLALTLYLSLAATLIVLVLGFPTAYVLARAAPRRASLLISGLLMASFVTVVIKALGLVVILSEHGLVNSLLVALGAPAIQFLSNRIGVLIGLVHYTLPLLVLLLFGVIQTIPVSLEHAAEIHGASRLGVLRRLVVPLAMPGVVAGGLIAFNMSMGAFTSAVLLGGGRVLTLPVLIQRKIVADVDYPLGSALSTTLLVVVFVLNVACSSMLLRGRRARRAAA
jgi:ABC-type spermidine/putrescine transport system permease subunit I